MDDNRKEELYAGWKKAVSVHWSGQRNNIRIKNISGGLNGKIWDALQDKTGVYR